MQGEEIARLQSVHLQQDDSEYIVTASLRTDGKIYREWEIRGKACSDGTCSIKTTNSDGWREWLSMDKSPDLYLAYLEANGWRRI